MPRPGRFQWIITVLIACGQLTADIPPVNPPADESDNLKAVFIYNFTRYITWPAETQNTDFTIGVLGDSKIIFPLQQLAAKKRVGDQPIAIHLFKRPQELIPCHILFISASEQHRITDIINLLAKKTVLTIGDTPGYGEHGVMINFFLQSDQIKFELNPASLERSGLKASSQLQKLARIIP